MKPHNLVEMLAQTVKRYSDKTALMWKHEGTYQSMTYQKLWNTVRDFAFGLERLGVRSGTKVAIFSENNPRWIISDFAILSLGAVTVPIDPSLTGKQITFILQNADVDVIIIQRPDMLEQLIEVFQISNHLILMHGKAEGSYKALQFETVLQMGQTVAIEDYDWVYPSIQSSDLATIVYPSEATDDLKGVMLSHGNILSNIESAHHCVPFTSFDILLSILPLSHTLERIMGHFAPMYVGAAIGYTEKVDNVTQNMKEVRPTVMISMPHVFENIYNPIMAEMTSSPAKKRLFESAMKIAEKYIKIASQGYNWPIPKMLRLQYALVHFIFFAKIHEKLGGNLRFMVSGEANLDADIRQFFSCMGIPIVETYGLAESSSVIAFNRLAAIKPGTVGKPLPGTEIRLLADGELLVKSPSVMLGYYKQEEATAKKVVNGWLHTGEIAHMDEEGYVRIVSRKQGMSEEKEEVATQTT